MLDVVFVGGGANLAFLHDAVQQAAYAALDMKVRISSRELSARGLPTSPERLAVSLGGTTPAWDWPDTLMREPKFWHGLPV